MLVTHGDGFSVWDVTQAAKRTEARISLPEADTPGNWQAVLADRGELLTVRGSNVQRNRLADGALVPGSVFTLDDTESRDFQNFQPAIDASETLMAVFNADAIEIWDLLKGSRVDRLHLADDTEAIDVRFGQDRDEVNFVLRHFRTEKAAGIYPQRWHRSGGVGLLEWIGLEKTRVEPAPDETVPAIFAWPGADGGLEPTDPQALAGSDLPGHTHQGARRAAGITRRVVARSGLHRPVTPVEPIASALRPAPFRFLPSRSKKRKGQRGRRNT